MAWDRFKEWNARRKEKKALKHQEKQHDKNVISQTKNLKKDYPILASLKLTDIVASTVEADLHDMAKQSDGAVQEISTHQFDGYSVIIITEEDLRDSGISEEDNISD